MTSSQDNRPNRVASKDDFTLEAFRALVRLALAAYPVATYRKIPWGERFVLWRHDCDYSLNRALALARVEAEEGLTSTFFVNPHSEFYNMLQSDQSALVRELLALGHDVGLHFDAGFYGDIGEEELAFKVAQESKLLQDYFGCEPSAFSFHNPVPVHLACDADTYGGLVNCYSRKFMTEVAYCSDSNGYWRFRRLQDVLSEATDPCLQVLTHPGWWLDKPMPARQRIFRAAYGRARATMSLYDRTLAAHGRENLAGSAQALLFLKVAQPRLYLLCDALWMSGELETLFVELWRLHERQIYSLCTAVICAEWKVPARDVNAFFAEASLVVEGWRLFSAVFGEPLRAAAKVNAKVYSGWIRARGQLVHGRGSAPVQDLEEACVGLCQAVQSLATWGREQAFSYDGLAQPGSIAVTLCRTAGEGPEGMGGDRLTLPSKRWEEFKAALAKVYESGTS